MGTRNKNCSVGHSMTEVILSSDVFFKEEYLPIATHGRWNEETCSWEPVCFIVNSKKDIVKEAKWSNDMVILNLRLYVPKLKKGQQFEMNINWQVCQRIVGETYFDLNKRNIFYKYVNDGWKWTYSEELETA